MAWGLLGSCSECKVKSRHVERSKPTLEPERRVSQRTPSEDEGMLHRPVLTRVRAAESRGWYEQVGSLYS